MKMNEFQEIFLQSLKDPLSLLLDIESETIASMAMDQVPIQDPFRYRAKYLGLKVSNLLLDEKGELNLKRLEQLISLFKEGPFLLGPKRGGDFPIFHHIQSCLEKLLTDRQIWTFIRKFSPPLCHKKGEEAIRETLWPEPIRVVQTVHVRKAVLAAWLTFLRQSTGSCFATAPAIFIQEMQPLSFFKDLYDLLTLGQMKRVIGGKEYSVPFSLSAGVGDLQKKVSVPFFGLVMALEEVGVKLTKEREKIIREGHTVEEALKRILLEEADLTEEAIRDEEHLKRIQMTPLLARQGAIYFQRPSERSIKIAEWKKRFEKACISFKAITDCSLLRIWEYSMASFSDVKTEFARWNLYIGLGLHPDQKNGIGAFVYDQVNRHLQKCQLEIDRLSDEYEEGAQKLKALEVMIHGAVGLSLNQLKAEWTAHNLSLNHILETRSRLITRADSLVKFFSWLIEKYDEKLQEFFQELFDPAIKSDHPIYDDSPAGFRLVYKHGRSDASQWSPVYTKEEYIEFLRDFFSRIENELPLPEHIGKELFQEITTALIQFIQEDLFFTSALLRSKEQGRLSPWHYISGGTLQTLLMAYCNRDRPFKEESLVPHSTEDLLAFLSKFQRGPLLMHSPTHAFLFYPEWMQNRREGNLFPQQKWTEAMQEHLAHKISERLPFEERALFIHLLRQKENASSNALFRANLIDSISSRLENKEAIVDSVLYENAVLLNPDEALEAIRKIYPISIHRLEGSFFGSFEIYEMAKKGVVQSNKKVFFKEDWDEKIACEMRKWNLLPNPILFADTNWSDWYFGFLKNPTTTQLELWRFNRTGTQGFPMHDWKEFLIPTNTSPWIILKESAEYIP